MDKILERKPSAPLLNVLLVRGDTRQPGGGAREYLAEHFPKKKWLREKGAHKNYPDLWKRIVEQAARKSMRFPIGTTFISVSLEETMNTSRS